MLSFTTAHAPVSPCASRSPIATAPTGCRGTCGSAAAGSRSRRCSAASARSPPGARSCAARRGAHDRHPLDGVRDGRLLLYRRRQGLDPRSSYRIARPERPAGLRGARVPHRAGADLRRGRPALRRCSSAAKLIGEEGIVYAIFVLPVPQPAVAGVGPGGGGGARALGARERAHPGASRGHQDPHRPDPHPQPGLGTGRGSRTRRLRRRSTGRRSTPPPASRGSARPRPICSGAPCRVIIETDNPARASARPRERQRASEPAARSPRCSARAAPSCSASSSSGWRNSYPSISGLGRAPPARRCHDLGHLAVERAQCEARDGQERRRCSACPSACEKSRLETGAGAVALTGPLQRSSSSAASICRRRPRRGSRRCTARRPRPGRRRRAGTAAASSRARRRRVEHDAGAICTTRIPSSEPVGLAPPIPRRLGQEVLARGGPPRRAAPRRGAVVAGRRGADQGTRARRSAARSPARRLRVPFTRLSRIARLTLALQRWATGSPARCTTASRPSSAAAGAGSPSGPRRRLHLARRGARAARSGSRESTVTSRRRSCSREPGAGRSGRSRR